MAKAAFKISIQDEEGSYHQQIELRLKYEQTDFAYEFLSTSHLELCVWFTKPIIIV